MAPASRPFVILEEDGLIMSDENEGTQIGQTRKGIPIIVPKLKSHFISRPSMNEGLSIGHDVVSLVPVNIHSVFLFAVVPFQSCKPPLCSLPGNAGLVNPQPSDQDLKALTCDNVANVLCLDEPAFCPLRQLPLDLLQDIVIFKNC